MEQDKKGYNEFLKKVDSIELIPEKELKNMDFYELAYYMQTLNMIDSFGLDENLENGESL